ncbi:MAG TPA: anti-sigma factor [Chloroflexia bacterium]|nr:anti-sigma factor [Chloroflexia bacterium]
MKQVNCQDVEPLIPATAAGALDEDEAQAIRAHLAICPPCVKHYHDFQQTVEQLAYAVPQVPPPAALRVKILQVVTTTAQPAPAQVPSLMPLNGARPAGRARPDRPQRPLATLYQQFAPATLAACLLLLIGAGIWIGVLSERMTMMERGVAQQQAVRDLLHQPGAEMAALKPTASTIPAGGQVIMAPGHRQVAVMAVHLPPPANGRTYQLWMLQHGNQQPVPAGLLYVDGDGTVMTMVDTPSDPGAMAGVRITDEPSAGSRTPTGTNWLEAWYR